MTRQQMIKNIEKKGYKVIFAMKSDNVYLKRNGRLMNDSFTSVTDAYNHTKHTKLWKNVLYIKTI